MTGEGKKFLRMNILQVNIFSRYILKSTRYDQTRTIMTENHDFRYDNYVNCDVSKD
jgi:hypothetical protein